ncbi:MAG: CheR family methyltransferase [Desulfococcaceae bacterium]
MMDHQFDKVIEAVRRDTGIRLPESNYRTVRDFIRERCECLGASPERYLDRAREDAVEFERLLDAVTINETYFFREERHFRLLENRIFPELYRKGERYPLIWSASCATGEEAVSLAVLAERFWGGQGKEAGFTVWATDINPCSLKIFENGIYSGNAFRRDGSGYHPLLKSYLTAHDRGHQLDVRLRERLRIRKLNLFADRFSELPGNFSVVFFRNTLIYMDLPVRGEILDKIASVLSPGGYLFLSAAEMPLLSHHRLRLTEADGVYFFRKTEEKVPASAQTRIRRESAPEPAGVDPPALKPNPSESESRTTAIDLAAVLEFANQKAKDERLWISGNAEFSAACGLLDVFSRINANRTEEAAALLAEIEKRLSPNEILCYLRGYLCMNRLETEEARRHFQKALRHHPGFWPARFYSASLIQHAAPHQARTEYRICRKDLEAYLARGGSEYQFLLEEFSPRYFHRMCGKWIDRLSREFID